MSLVEETLWQKLEEPKLKMTIENLRNASRRLTKFKGVFFTIISYRGYEVPVRLYVGHGNGSILFGISG